MTFADEMLMAYADGELDPVARAEIEAAMAADAEIADIVARHRALRARVREAYAGALDTPVPARLSDLLAPPVTPVVIPFRRGAQPAAATVASARHRGLPRWSALAASVALGLFVGLNVPRGPETPYRESAAGLVARGDLARVLTGQLASDSGTVRIGLSFRDHSGTYCRTFHMQHQTPLAGLACRAGTEWRLQVLAAAAPEAGELRAAAAMPIAVLQAVDAAIDGEPLDAEAETAARDTGWEAPGK
jgi:hypothetical protein